MSRTVGASEKMTSDQVSDNMASPRGPTIKVIRRPDHEPPRLAGRPVPDTNGLTDSERAGWPQDP